MFRWKNVSQAISFSLLRSGGGEFIPVFLEILILNMDLKQFHFGNQEFSNYEDSDNKGWKQKYFNGISVQKAGLSDRDMMGEIKAVVTENDQLFS